MSIINLFILGLPEELNDKEVLCKLIGVDNNIGYVRHVKLYKKKSKNCANLNVYIWDRTLYQSFMKNKSMEVKHGDNGCITIKRFKTSYELKLEVQLKNTKRALINTRREGGFQCGSCNKTKNLTLDDEDTGLHYCNKCWTTYNNYQCAKSKQENIYQNNFLINKLWASDNPKRQELISRYQKVNKKLEQEITNLNC